MAMFKKIGVIGSGVVGQVLADGLLEHGYQVMRGSREPAKLADWRKGVGGAANTGTFAEAARFGEAVLLAVKGGAAEAALKLCGPDNLKGKTVIDATNPIAEEPPVHGVLRFFTGPNDSLMERLQRLAPGARLVKAFSCVGNAHMVHPDFGGPKPTMFICGNDAQAKGDVRTLLDQFGWETEDLGAIEAARAIEPLCQLWCIPGLTGHGWSHAFKLLRR
jgi:8-hydroxy-5-deazaflavin:NADPH oxidoreductase